MCLLLVCLCLPRLVLLVYPHLACLCLIARLPALKPSPPPMKIDERRPRQLCRSLSLRGITLLSFESQRLICLSRCLSCLSHHPLDHLCLGLFPLLQCLSSPPLPLSFPQTRPDKQKSKDKTEQDQPRHDPTKQAQTRVSQPCRLDSLCLVLPVLTAMKA